MKNRFTYQFLGSEQVAILQQRTCYDNDRLALAIVDDEGYPSGSLSVNLPNPFISLANDEFYLDVNNNSEELIEAVEKAGVFTRTGQVGHSGFVSYPLCKLTDEAKKMFEMEG